MRQSLLVLVAVACFILTILAGCFAQPGSPTPQPGETIPQDKARLSGEVLVPTQTQQAQGEVQTKQVQGQTPLANATVRIINPKNNTVVATTTTDDQGKYSVDVPPGGPYIVEAVKGNLKVLDVSPKVEAGKSYDLGTADATSTAIALVFQEMVKKGQDPENIDIDQIQNASNFNNLVNAVTSALQNGQDPTQSEQVMDMVDNIVSGQPETPEISDETPPQLERLIVTLKNEVFSDGYKTRTVESDGELYIFFGDEASSVKIVFNEPVKISGTTSATITLITESGTFEMTTEKALENPNADGYSQNLILTFSLVSMNFTGEALLKIPAGLVEDAAGNKNGEFSFTLNFVPVLHITTCKSGLTESIGNAPSNYNDLAYSLKPGEEATAITLESTLLIQGINTSEHWIKLEGIVKGFSQSKEFGLYLDLDSDQKNTLNTYYQNRFNNNSDPSDPYYIYLISATEGATPIAYISCATVNSGDSTFKLIDGARYKVGGLKVDFAIPDDFPKGTYTVKGSINGLGLVFKLTISQ